MPFPRPESKGFILKSLGLRCSFRETLTFNILIILGLHYGQSLAGGGWGIPPPWLAVDSTPLVAR